MVCTFAFTFTASWMHQRLPARSRCVVHVIETAEAVPLLSFILPHHCSCPTIRRTPHHSRRSDCTKNLRKLYEECQEALVPCWLKIGQTHHSSRPRPMVSLSTPALPSYAARRGHRHRRRCLRTPDEVKRAVPCGRNEGGPQAPAVQRSGLLTMPSRMSPVTSHWRTIFPRRGPYPRGEALAVCGGRLRVAAFLFEPH